MLVAGGASPAGDELVTVTVLRDEHGYGMKVSGDNPVYVQSVKEHGAAWRAGLRAGDRILRVNNEPVHCHSHQQVVLMIRANPSTVLTVHQNTQRHKTPITAPVPVNSEKQRQVEFTKVNTFRLMLEDEQKYITGLKNELSKVPDVRKQSQLEAAERRCQKLQREIDAIVAAQPETVPGTPRMPRTKQEKDKDKIDKPMSPTSTPNTGFLSGLPRSLSNLTGQSLRNLRQRQNKVQQENTPPLVRQNSDESNNRKRHNNTVPMVPTTCLDNTPPPLPPRLIRNPLTPNVTPLNPLAKPKPSSSQKSYPSQRNQFRKSSHSLDGGLEGPQPNSIALQMSYPLVNAPPPPLQTDNRNSVPVLHVRSQSSPEHLDHGLARPPKPRSPSGTPPGTPPPPYRHSIPSPPNPINPINTINPCSPINSTNPIPSAPPLVPSAASHIISMEEDDEPTAENTTNVGLFSNLRCVLESKARTAVLLNWLLGERRPASSCLLLIVTEGYRAANVPIATLRRWAYEIHSIFLIPDAVLHMNGVDENMANEIEHVLANDYEKEELLRNVFRKARQKAKEELSQQLADFQIKRQVGLGTLYGPDDGVIEKCMLDKQQEQVVVERLICTRMKDLSLSCSSGSEMQVALLAALSCAAGVLGCRPAAVVSAGGAGAGRGSLLQSDKLYKQRVKLLAKNHPHPLSVRGHRLQLRALFSVAHCHVCELLLAGLAPQLYLCSECELRVHGACARSIEEACCMDGAPGPLARLRERIKDHDGNDRKRKSASAAHFLNMERSIRKAEEDPAWDVSANNISDRRDESDESLYESADNHSDAISASDDALPRLSKTPTISKESLKLAVTDEEDANKTKKTHRKTMSLSNPLELVKNIDWLDTVKKEDPKEIIPHVEDKVTLRKNNKNEKNDTDTKRKPRTSTVSALNLFRRKKPTSLKTVSVVAEVFDKLIPKDEILNHTKFLIEEEQKHTAACESKDQSESEKEEARPPKVDHRRRLSRQTSRGKSRVRGKSQSVKVNTLRKSHSGTLKKNKKKVIKTPTRSRQTSIVDSPTIKKNSKGATEETEWIFSVGNRGESRREGSADDTSNVDHDLDTTDQRDTAVKDTNSKSSRGVNRAESCRERDAPRRGKHRNASDPNRLTAHENRDLEPNATTAPSGSSSSSSLSSRSNESNTVTADHNAASQSELSDEEEFPKTWSGPTDHTLTPIQRKRQEVIHELIVSEQSHNRWLKVLSHVFLRPLEASSLIPNDELRELFPNLPAVRVHHSRLLNDLKTAKANATDNVVGIGAVADAVLNTLSHSGYSLALSRFCRGQRAALDRLKSRSRKHKELLCWLQLREQLPSCGRLRLADLLPCVWQRLTKYQLLLENIVATVEASDPIEEVERLKLALSTAKDVLQHVDTSIRTTENEQRLRLILSKLEVRPAECEELRGLDLPALASSLRYDGDLVLRVDNKKIPLLALLTSQLLVLLVREGDRYCLRPLSTSQTPLSPLVRWDTVLFRPNAAVKNTFFLMNINGVQMHELSANSAAEYTTWVKHIQEAPLAKLTELKLANHQHSRSQDDNGTPVSRASSDASDKCTEPINNINTSSSESDHTQIEQEPVTATATEQGVDSGTIPAPIIPPLNPPSVVVVSPAVEESVCMADLVYTQEEQLRRLDQVIAASLRAKSSVVAKLLGAAPTHYGILSDMAVAETMGHVDIDSDFSESQLNNSNDVSNTDIHHLLLAAIAQANQLTEAISSALRTGPDIPDSRTGLCDTCRPRSGHGPTSPVLPSSTPEERSQLLQSLGLPAEMSPAVVEEMDRGSGREFEDTRPSDLAHRLVPISSGLHCALSQLLSRLSGPGLLPGLSGLPALSANRAMERDRGDAERRRAHEYEIPDDLALNDDIDHQHIQEQPSNGG